MLSSIFLLISSLAYAFGNYPLCDWTSWVGWGGVMTTIFIILGASLFKALEAIAPVFWGNFSFYSSHWKSDSEGWLKINSRRWVQYAINICLISASLLLAVHVLFEALRLPLVKEVEIEIKNLPSDLEGLRIVQVTDLHISPAIRRNFVQRLVGRVNGLMPDIIALTGDIVDDVHAEISKDVAPLAGLHARLGKFFVTGNHEYLHGADEWISEMEQMGISALLN